MKKNIFLKNSSFPEVISSAVYRVATVLLCIGVPCTLKNGNANYTLLYFGIAVIGGFSFAIRYQLYQIRKEELYEKYRDHFSAIMNNTKLQATKQGKVRKGKRYSVRCGKI